MEHPRFSPQTSVADLLAASPRVASTLLNLRVDCIGCSMNHFCSLQEMCRQYGLELEAVMKQVSKNLEVHTKH
jgi:hybrid cluster-associated redox disulfide protein